MKRIIASIAMAASVSACAGQRFGVPFCEGVV